MSTGKKNYKKNYLKLFFGLILSLLVRLIPFRAPNIEPVLAAIMPFSKYYGTLVGFSFGVLSVLFYDILTGTLGMHTFFTAGAYGIVGICAALYFKTRESTPLNYVRFAIPATLFFDAATGLTVGPLFFHQSFTGALAGQIPFTALHLLGNISFAFILSPAIYKFMVRKKTYRPVGKERKPVPEFIPLNHKII